MNHTLNRNIASAAKWSTITEILAKLVIPISNMILARLLNPKDFGVVATATMIMSFADMITDAGFQKYLIQHEFNTEKEIYDNTNVAFWTNLLLSITIWSIIVFYSVPLAKFVGSPGLESVIIVSCISLPITSFSSIQMALYRRNFDYKTIFITRMIGVCIPFVVTIPLTLIIHNYWALIIGTLCINLSNSAILTIKSKWKPTAFYSFKILKDMMSFSIWSLLEAVAVWFISWSDTFIVGSLLNSYFLGIYRTSIITVGSIIALITSAISPVMLTALSRLQNDEQEYKNMLFKFQRFIGLFVFPMGVGMYMYSDFITNILLGSQWKEASRFIGIWGLMSAVSIIFSTCSGIIYISKGKPKISVLAQVLQLIVLIPAIYISASHSFTALIYTRSLIRIEGYFIHFLIVYFVFGISPLAVLKNIKIYIIASIIMASFALFLQEFSEGLIWNSVSIVSCGILYFGIILLYRNSREEIVLLIKHNINHKIISG